MKKIFNNSIISNTQVRKFVQTFAKKNNWHNIDINTGNLGYGWIHYSFIRNSKPKKILCVGSKYGYIPAICALACKHNKYGHVDFVDASYDEKKGHKNNWGGVGFWKKISPKKHFNTFKLSKYITTHITTTKQFSQKNSTIWDYIYIDGDHSYKGVLSDYKYFWPKLSKAGFILFHDINIESLNNQKYGTKKLWQELRKKHKHTIEFPHKFGLGIIQKPS